MVESYMIGPTKKNIEIRASFVFILKYIFSDINHFCWVQVYGIKDGNTCKNGFSYFVTKRNASATSFSPKVGKRVFSRMPAFYVSVFMGCLQLITEIAKCRLQRHLVASRGRCRRTSEVARGWTWTVRNASAGPVFSDCMTKVHTYR